MSDDFLAQAVQKAEQVLATFGTGVSIVVGWLQPLGRGLTDLVSSYMTPAQPLPQPPQQPPPLEQEPPQQPQPPQPQPQQPQQPLPQEQVPEVKPSAPLVEEGKDAFIDRQKILDGKCDVAVERAGKIVPMSAALTKLVQDAKDAKATTKTASDLQPANWPAAALTLDPFEKSITDLEGGLTAQENDRKTYETRRGKLAAEEEAVGRIKNPVTPQKELVEAYERSVAATKLSVDAGEYDAALVSMAQLETDLKAAIAEKRKGVEANAKLKVDEIMGGLTAVNGAGDQVWQEGRDPDPPLPPLPPPSPEWHAAVDKIMALQLDEDFKAEYDKKNAATAKALAADPLIKEANTNWATWAADPVTNKQKMLDAMKQIVKLQSEIIGLNPPKDVKLMDPPGTGDLCGQYNPPPDDFIELNPGQDNFGDFRELLDTMTHENTHALQANLVGKYKKYLANANDVDAVKPGDSDFAAAMTLWMNDSKGYITADDSYKYNPPGGAHAYLTQVCESHAWSAGENAGKGAHDLLNTPTS